MSSYVNKLDPARMESLQRMRGIMYAISGKHFHEHFHIADDLMDDADMHEVHYLEIGSYYGCSASFMASNPRVRNVTAIDPMRFDGQENAFWTNVNKFKHSAATVNLIKEYSQKADVSVIPPVDVLFIDGCHRFKSVVSDFDMYAPLVKAGGYVLFDDYMDAKFSPEVRKAVDHLVSTRLDAGDAFEVIGTRDNDVGAAPATLKRNNIFILKKRDSLKM